MRVLIITVALLYLCFLTIFLSIRLWDANTFSLSLRHKECVSAAVKSGDANGVSKCDAALEAATQERDGDDNGQT